MSFFLRKKLFGKHPSSQGELRLEREFKASAQELRKAPFVQGGGSSFASPWREEEKNQELWIVVERKVEKNKGTRGLGLTLPVTLMIASCQDQNKAFPIAQISFVFAWAARQL